MALTEVVPLSLPMVNVTGTGFVVPVKLARCADAANAYRKVPVGVTSACRLTPLMTPAKVNNGPVFLKEPGGMVVENVPTRIATGWVTGLIAGAVLRKVKLDSRAKASDYRNSVGAKIRHIGVCPIRGDGDPKRVLPHRDRRRHGVCGRGNHRNSVGAKIRHIGVCPIRGDGDPKGV
jgi:hypothetical protein